MRVIVANSISEFSRESWNRLNDAHYPFLNHEFLHLAERTGCVAEETGWLPRHIGIFDSRDNLVGAMPLYEKNHSWGEFVFDWGWAQAYQRVGLNYYPKLVAAVPFTPATSTRLLATSNKIRMTLLAEARDLAIASGCSSLHVQFPKRDELECLRKSGFKVRKDCQFHWHNQNYRDFDDFLSTFSSAKRKKVRRDRRHVREQGFQFHWHCGDELDENTWDDVYHLISQSFFRRGSAPYFNKDFFVGLSAQLPDSIRVVVARLAGSPVGAAVFFDSGSVLYGRYWGSEVRFNALHFETCYYQGIDFCISQGRQVFEPGTQGEHKISRGFQPVETWSAHWLEQPSFLDAIGEFLTDEASHIDHYIEAVNEHSPYKSSHTDIAGKNRS